MVIKRNTVRTQVLGLTTLYRRLNAYGTSQPWQTTRQSALAKIGMVAYEAKTNEMLGAGGVSASLANDSNTFFFGMGPFQSGSARVEIERTTPRRVGQPNQELPSIVAFRESSTRNSPDRLQLAGEQREAK